MGGQAMTAEERLLERLARRVGFYAEKHEATGDEKYARLAAEADAHYRFARAHFGPCVTFDTYYPADAEGVLS